MVIDTEIGRPFNVAGRNLYSGPPQESARPSLWPCLCLLLWRPGRQFSPREHVRRIPCLFISSSTTAALEFEFLIPFFKVDIATMDTSFGRGHASRQAGYSPLSLFSGWSAFAPAESDDFRRCGVILRGRRIRNRPKVPFELPAGNRPPLPQSFVYSWPSVVRRARLRLQCRVGPPHPNQFETDRAQKGSQYPGRVHSVLSFLVAQKPAKSPHPI